MYNILSEKRVNLMEKSYIRIGFSFYRKSINDAKPQEVYFN